MHVAVLVLVLLVTRSKQKTADGSRHSEPAELARQVQIGVPAPTAGSGAAASTTTQDGAATAKSAASATRDAAACDQAGGAPPPDKAQRVPEDNANAPPDATRSKGQDSDQPEGGAPATTPTPAADAVPTMESEAQRIFGTKRVATAAWRRAAGGPADGGRPAGTRREVRAAGGDRGLGRTAVRNGGGTDHAERTTAGRSPGRTCRCWAHRSSPSTGPDGEYRFRFDMSLVDNCRTQYVRVTAKGYESRLLVLMVGENVRSDDVNLQKRGRFGL